MINMNKQKKLKTSQKINWKLNEHGVWHVRNGSVCLVWINKLSTDTCEINTKGFESSHYILSTIWVLFCLLPQTKSILNAKTSVGLLEWIWFRNYCLIVWWINKGQWQWPFLDQSVNKLAQAHCTLGVTYKLLITGVDLSFFYVFEMSRFVQPLKDKNLTDRTKANKMKSTDDQKPDIQQYW